MNNFDPQYINITKQILNEGIDRPDRTGIGSRAIWGVYMRHNMSDGFPIITHRKISLRIAFEELMWMLRGSSNVKELQDKNIHIWDGNSTREFLDNRGLTYLPEGHIGKGYGFNIRNFGGSYAMTDPEPYYEDGKEIDKRSYPDYTKLDMNGTDQLKSLLDGLKNDPNSRRHLILQYNPNVVDESALPPCHLYHQYQILGGKLNSSFILRSNDFLYGASYNWCFYALLNKIIANYLKIESGNLVYFGNDVHI